MFDKNKFALIIKKISESYNNQREFSEKSSINRTYLSQYLNMKLDSPPKPEILERLAEASHGITSYSELMKICGYLEGEYLKDYYINNYNISDKEFEIAMGNNLSNGLNEEELNALSEIVKDFNERKRNSNLDKYINNLNEISKAKVIHNYNEMLKSQLSVLSSVRNDIRKKEKQEESNIFPITDKPILVPILGKISAGLPLLATENIESYEFAPSSYIKEGFDYFYLRVNGDSMNLKFNDGDIVLVQKQDGLENDEIGVILVDGQDATVKKYKFENGLVILSPMSTNPEHVVQIYNPKDISIKIVGKVVSYQGKI